MNRFQPNGWPTVIPRMFTPDVGGVVGFLKSVFDADGEMPAGAPAVVRIGDSVIMVSDGEARANCCQRSFMSTSTTPIVSVNAR